jgi:uncharacterized YigZ family protein
MDEYSIPVNTVTIDQYVKRSQFICHLAHTSDRDKAMDFIGRIAAEHSNANHNCWAFIAGAPDDASCWGMSDDGEPKGCAGKPMFNVLAHCGAGEICAVVTRYFGGIKLGTGGMARAYSSTVKLALEEMAFQAKIHFISRHLFFPYNMQKDVEHFIQLSEGIIRKTEYGIKIEMEVDIPMQKVSKLEAQLQEIGKGCNILIQPDPIADSKFRE